MSWVDYRKVPGWFSDVEASFMRKQVIGVKDLSGVIVEIGSYLGRSSIVIAQVAKENHDKVYCIDIWDSSIYDSLPEQQGRVYKPYPIPEDAFEQFIDNIRAAGVFDTIIPMEGKSADFVRGWNNPIKLLFIDACHEYSYVAEDCLLWKKHVMEGGVVLFHDYSLSWPGVMRAVDECMTEKEFSVIGQAGSLKGFTKK